MSLALWPCAALPAAASLAGLGRDCREAALLARGRLACLLRVDLPVALPAGGAGALLAFALAVAELGAPDLFVISTAARDLLKGFEGSYDYAEAAGRSLPLLALAAACAAALVWGVGRRGLAALGRERRAPAAAPAWARWYATALSALALGSVLGGLALNAGSARAIARAAGEDYDLVLRSLLLAGLSSLLAIALCWPLLGLLRGDRCCAYALALGALALPLLLPGTLWGLGLLRVRALLASAGPAGHALAWFLHSPIILVWAASARAALGAGLVLGWGRRRTNPEMLDAGRTAGLSAPRRWLLAAGLMRRYLVAALLLGAALALGELGAAVMIAPPGWETLAVRVFNAMHNYHGDVVAALALVTTAGSAVLATLGAALATRR
jgi:iron(III) transport system permease protein